MEVITPLRLHLLQVVGRHPGAHRDKLLALKGVQASDLDYLATHDLVREREAGCFHVTHLGQLALKR
jgi:hypothetical protein